MNMYINKHGERQAEPSEECQLIKQTERKMKPESPQCLLKLLAERSVRNRILSFQVSMELLGGSVGEASALDLSPGLHLRVMSSSPM